MGRDESGMVPVVSMVGRPDSGKSVFMEKLIPELQGRGYSVGVIKHTYHEVPLDTPGKDTDRFAAAGAAAVALVTARGMAFFRPDAPDLDLEELSEEYFTDFDIVMVEGFKKESQPKIEILADGASPNEEISGKIAIVSNDSINTALPVIRHDDIAAAADLIEKNFLLKGSRSEVKIWVDGKFVPLKPFVKAFVGQTVKGMVNALKGAKKAEKIRIKIGR